MNEQETEILRRQLLAKGQQVAKQLADLMAGKGRGELFEIEGIDHHLKPEDRLRSFLKLLNERRQLLERKDPSFGLCERCGEALAWVELEQLPWVTRCRQCAGA